MQCHYGGKVHSFSSLQSNNISVNKILHEWKSSIEKVDEYSRYIKHPHEVDGFLCECTNLQSFGKSCEYRLPIGTTFEKTIDWEVSMKEANEWQVQMHGNIICYTTLECNYGLLCLDWREICNGFQQCMFGLDEENCDFIEFNECEDDEYRCINGMCIPEEYFLDGQFDCLDWSDEIQWYYDAVCALEEVSSVCDDRLCPPDQWPCGDGQCISDRLYFQVLDMSTELSFCENRREQYYLCETHGDTQMWTLPNGRCYGAPQYKQFTIENQTIDERCEYLLKCFLTQGYEKQCPCKMKSSCKDHLQDLCFYERIQYPKGAIITPYTFYYYDIQYLSHRAQSPVLYLNGTIKCRGFSIKMNSRYVYHRPELRSRRIEYSLCDDDNSPWHILRINNVSYNANCHNNSKTFNNNLYKLIDICKKSKECISVYRINDGIENCLDGSDENIKYNLSNVNHYRFQCSFDEKTYLNVISIGDSIQNCLNNFDELWMGTTRKLSTFLCHSESTNECNILRQYIKMSWASFDQNKSHIERRVSFRDYCDTFWNINSNEEDLNQCRQWWICLDYQWQCRSGQCINTDWVLDGEWDCVDASDEEGVFDYSIPDRNFQLIQLNELRIRSNVYYEIRPFSMFCNQSREFGCIPINVSNSFYNSLDNRPCISFNQIGDGHIDCYGGIDERNTLQHCVMNEMLGYHVMCPSNRYNCPHYMSICHGRCFDGLDDLFWCNYHKNLSSNNILKGDFVCFNGTYIKSGRCNINPDCPFAEDEYMCYYKRSFKLEVSYRKLKFGFTVDVGKILKLYRYPKTTKTSESMNKSLQIKEKIYMKIMSSEVMSSLLPYLCNRGIGIEMYNKSIICFCPPQYYGDKCQFQTDRLIVLVHLNLSQSIYNEQTDHQIVIKLLVLFMFRNEIILQHEFHVRPSIESIVYEKKMIYFVYSRSFEYLLHKKERYKNRSNIINDHPYSIRIEAYEMKNNDEVSIVAIWRYPIYFDYLPVFRLAKVLRLIKLNNDKNPCLSNPCNENQQCYEIINENSTFICICKANFGGENCSVRNQLCIDEYCSSKSLCKPDYQGFQKGNRFPYCLCLLNRFGNRCEIEYDQCLSNPCQNNGLCFPKSNPNDFICLCNDSYYGDKCQFNKPKVQLNITKTVNHIGSVIQYFKIESISLELILVDQRIFHTLPTMLRYINDGKTLSDMILIKLYFSYNDIQSNIYLLSLHIKETTILGTTEVTEKSQCVSILALISNYSPFQYHYLCRNNTNLTCFYDESYICICEEDHSRVECFGYNHNFDLCSNCLSGGRCLRGNQFKLNDFICLCPPCYSGSNCQFNSNSFSFTLDQLFFIDLTAIKFKRTLCLLIIISALLFIIALLNNTFSFVTFRRQNCLCNGVGQYLFCMSIINQICVGFFAVRLIHLSLTISGIYSHPMIDKIFCKILSYLLNCSIRIAYWLASLVTIERIYSTVYLKGQWLKKPRVARCLMAITFFLILFSGAYELVFVKSFSGFNNIKS
ncbi:unnamed protein product, partial [Rotaria sp. Silwood2]